MEIYFDKIPMYLVYGLASYTMGIAVILRGRKDSNFRLALSLNLLAIFGILHGLSDWGNAFIPTNIPAMDLFPTWKVIAFQRILESVSFFFLFCFGAKLLFDSQNRNYYLFIFPFLMFIVWLVNFIVFMPSQGGSIDHWLDVSESWSRYLLAFPAGITTAYGFFLQLPEAQRFNDKRVLVNLWGVITAFLCFSLFGGLIVAHPVYWIAQVLNADYFREITGIPIEVFRMITALLIMFCITRLLTIFDLEQQRKLEESRYLQAIWQERERFARDLHDDVIQSIYSVGLELQCTKNIMYTCRDDSHTKIDSSINRLDEVIRSIRAYIQRLETEDREQDLRTLLMNTIEQFKELSGPELEISIDLAQNFVLQQVLKETEWRQHIRQIVREALNNVYHHAEATWARVKVIVEDNYLKVTIEDNGSGIPSTPAKSSTDEINSGKKTEGDGLGLKNMQARARLLGGKLRINSKQAIGTIVELYIPLRRI